MHVDLGHLRIPAMTKMLYELSSGAAIRTVQMSDLPDGMSGPPIQVSSLLLKPMAATHQKSVVGTKTPSGCHRCRQNHLRCLCSFRWLSRLAYRKVLGPEGLVQQFGSQHPFLPQEYVS